MPNSSSKTAQIAEMFSSWNFFDLLTTGKIFQKSSSGLKIANSSPDAS